MAVQTTPIIYIGETINGLVIGDYLFDPLYATGGFYPQILEFNLQLVEGLISPPSVSVGVSPSNYNDLAPATILTGLTTQNQTYRVDLNTILPNVQSGTPIYVRVSVAAVATVFTFRAFLTGHHTD
jgi:hypothetical protein